MLCVGSVVVGSPCDASASIQNVPDLSFSWWSLQSSLLLHSSVVHTYHYQWLPKEAVVLSLTVHAHSGQMERADKPAGHGPCMCGCATAHGCRHPRCQVKGTITWWAQHFLASLWKYSWDANTTAISRESYVNLRQSMHTVKRNQARVCFWNWSYEFGSWPH
jgi:hypothetical protein